jgi:hypothetical protein
VEIIRLQKNKRGSPHSGTRCSRPAFIRLPGTVQSFLSKCRSLQQGIEEAQMLPHEDGT